MKSYESLIIIKPNLSDSEVTTLIDTIQGWITANEGEIVLSKPWGIKELAYPISKFTQGHYYQIQFNATRKTLVEMRNRIRVTETILRDLNVTMVSIQSKNTVQEEVAVIAE